MGSASGFLKTAKKFILPVERFNTIVYQVIKKRGISEKIKNACAVEKCENFYWEQD
jgi:hypothetical protein